MAEPRKTLRTQLRRPLCEMTPGLLDGMHQVFAQELEKGESLNRLYSKIARFKEADGPDGYRAFIILGIARDAIRRQSAEEVADAFMAWVEPSRISKQLATARPRSGAAVIRGAFEALRTTGRLPAPRKVGRPSEPTVETAVRVWTCDCLCQIAGLSISEAIDLWNQKFPALATLPKSYAQDSSQFRTQRGRVSADLDRRQEAQPPQPIKRRRGRPSRLETDLRKLLPPE